MSVAQAEKSFYICHIGSPIFTYCESVFRKSFTENVEVFLYEGSNGQHSFLCSYAVGRSVRSEFSYLSECEV